VGSVHFVDLCKFVTLVGSVHFVDLCKFVTLVGSVHFVDLCKFDPSWVRPFCGLVLTLGGVRPLCGLRSCSGIDTT